MTQLRQCLDEGHAFDVTDCAAQFDDANIGLQAGSINRNSSDALDPVLDGICDMGNAVDVSRDSGWVRRVQGKAKTGLAKPSNNRVRRHAHLNSLSKVVAAALLLDDLRAISKEARDRTHIVAYVLVDLAGGDVVVASQGDGEVSLVVSKVQVDFGALRKLSVHECRKERAWEQTRLQDKAFAMLGRGHQACINRDIGVNLDASDSQAECLQQL